MATKSDRFPKKFFTAEGVKETGPLVLEIEEEKLEDITDQKTGRTVSKSVVMFVDTEQKLVLNATNFDLIAEATGCGDTRHWPGHKIELFADRTSMGGKRVDCVRVRKPSGSRPALASAAAAPSSPLADELGSKLDDEIPF
jgi:hypothetical protein